MNVGEVVARSSKGVDSGMSRATEGVGRSPGQSAKSAAEDAWTVEKAHDPREDKAILAEAEQKLDEALDSLGLKLKYRVDESTDKLQVEIIEPDSGKVLRKLPPDDILKLARSVQQMARGFLDKMY